MFHFSGLSILIAFHSVMPHMPSVSPNVENAFFVLFGCLYELHSLRIVHLAEIRREGLQGSCSEYIIGKVSQQA